MKDLKAFRGLIDKDFFQPANDSRELFERLRDLSKRGTDAPGALDLKEIQQVCFALSVLLTEKSNIAGLGRDL